MADEYPLTLPAVAVTIDLPALLTRFEHLVRVALQVVESQDRSRSYSFTSSPRNEWPEDVRISADNKEWYVAFYLAMPAQRTAVLTALAHCLEEVGVTGMFEEI